jgi:hypothetical protein
MTEREQAKQPTERAPQEPGTEPGAATAAEEELAEEHLDAVVGGVIAVSHEIVSPRDGG